MYVTGFDALDTFFQHEPLPPIQRIITKNTHLWIITNNVAGKKELDPVYEH